MKYDNGEDNLSSLLKLDQDKLPLLQVRAEAHRVRLLILRHKDLSLT